MRMGFGWLAALACVLLAACRPGDQAPITVENAWLRATPAGARVAAAYMDIYARDGDVLLGAATPAAQRVEMHVTEEEDGIMRMRPLQTAPIAAGEIVRFEPGGRHFMLIGLTEPLAAGETVQITLRFEQAGDVATTAVVHAAAAHDAHALH